MPGAKNRDGDRPTPEWDRQLSIFVNIFGAAALILATITVALVLYVKFRDPSSAGAIIGPGIGTLVVASFWAVFWASPIMMREADRDFHERFHGRPRDEGPDIDQHRRK